MDIRRPKVWCTIRMLLVTNLIGFNYSSLVIYTNIIATPTAIYAVGVAKSYASYTLHVTALSSESGQLLSSAHVPSSITNPSSDLVLLTSNTVSRLAWLEQGSVKSVALSTPLKEKPATIKGADYKRILDVGLSKQGYMVAIMLDGTGRVFRLGEDGSDLNNIWEFEGSVSACKTLSLGFPHFLLGQ